MSKHVIKKVLTTKQENDKQKALSDIFKLAAENKLSKDDEKDLCRMFGA